MTAMPEKNHSLYKIAIPGFLLVGIAVFYIFLEPAIGKNSDAPPVPPVPVKLAAAIQKDIPIEITSIGTVVPLQTVSIKSRIDSQLVEVKFHDGDEVKAGDVLFVLDDRALKAQESQAKADLARDQAQLDNLKRQLNRNQELIKQNAVSQEALDDAKTALNVGNSTVLADKAALDNIQVQLSYTVIKAPISGRTGTVNLTLGNNVKANDTASMVTINQVRPIQVQTSLGQDYFDAVRKAMTDGTVSVKATRSNSDDVSLGSVSYIDNNIDQASGTFVSRAIFPNENESLWPGMLVKLTANVGNSSRAVIVPEVAIQNSPTGDFVFVVKDNVAKKTPVKVERIQDGQALIASGLASGEQVAVDGLMALKDGAKVTTGGDDKSQKKPAAENAK